jgi:hypothetical protein
MATVYTWGDPAHPEASSRGFRLADPGRGEQAVRRAPRDAQERHSNRQTDGAAGRENLSSPAHRRRDIPANAEAATESPAPSQLTLTRYRVNMVRTAEKERPGGAANTIRATPTPDSARSGARLSVSRMSRPYSIQGRLFC